MPGGTGRVLLQAALNGGREHPAMPATPQQLAREARRAVEAGARALHLHPVDSEGRETLDAGACAAALTAVRAVCPGIPISLTTSAAIEPDPRRRLERVSAWSVLPELITANQGEDGIVELAELLIARGVGIEAGLLSKSDAEAFVASGLADRCVRVLIEPLDADPGDALAQAEAMEEIVLRAGIELEQVHHGDSIACWAVNRRGLQRGHGIRTGLEDTPVLEDGSLAQDNGTLVRAAAALIVQAGRTF